MKKLKFFSPCIIIEVITEVGRSAKAYCEHTARSIPTLSDTVVTLIEMGESFMTHSRKTSLIMPSAIGRVTFLVLQVCSIY